MKSDGSSSLVWYVDSHPGSRKPIRYMEIDAEFGAVDPSGSHHYNSVPVNQCPLCKSIAKGTPINKVKRQLPKICETKRMEKVLETKCETRYYRLKPDTTPIKEDYYEQIVKKSLYQDNYSL